MPIDYNIEDNLVVKEAILKGEARGEAARNKELILHLKSKGNYSIAQVAELLLLTEEQVRQVWMKDEK